MSKDLQAIKYLNDTCINFLDRTKELYCTVTFTRKRAEILRDNIAEVEQSLNRLEAIDNANPSEALKCLESIKDVLWDDDFHYQRHSKLLDTIEQALLKAQEPKQYLKWEDLKKSNLEERLKVKLNNVKYELHFEKWTRYDDATRISLYLNEFCVMSIRLKTNYEKQFFNDLHLERVEE